MQPHKEIDLTITVSEVLGVVDQMGSIEATIGIQEIQLSYLVKMIRMPRRVQWQVSPVKRFNSDYIA